MSPPPPPPPPLLSRTCFPPFTFFLFFFLFFLQFSKRASPVRSTLAATPRSLLVLLLYRRYSSASCLCVSRSTRCAVDETLLAARRDGKTGFVSSAFARRVSTPLLPSRITRISEVQSHTHTHTHTHTHIVHQRYSRILKISS